jgi:hypothetical protein
MTASSSAPAMAHRRIPQRGGRGAFPIEVQNAMIERNAGVPPVTRYHDTQVRWQMN